MVRIQQASLAIRGLFCVLLGLFVYLIPLDTIKIYRFPVEFMMKLLHVWFEFVFTCYTSCVILYLALWCFRIHCVLLVSSSECILFIDTHKYMHTIYFIFYSTAHDSICRSDNNLFLWFTVISGKRCNEISYACGATCCLFLDFNDMFYATNSCYVSWLRSTLDYLSMYLLL